MVVLRKVAVAKGINPFSIRILQSQTYKEHVLILVSYLKISSKGEKIGCSSFFDTYRTDENTWVGAPGNSSCVSVGPFGYWSVGTGGGVSRLAMPGGELYSFIFGQMENEDIVAVTIYWEDGLSQIMPVSKGAYLAIRDGQHSYLKTEGKDATGRTVYTQEFPRP